MNAIKKTDENLVKVAKSICEIEFSTGVFTSDFEVFSFASTRCVFLSSNRDSIGYTILRMIPSNYFYRVSFVYDYSGLKLRLFIYYEVR